MAWWRQALVGLTLMLASGAAAQQPTVEEREAAKQELEKLEQQLEQGAQLMQQLKEIQQGRAAAFATSCRGLVQNPPGVSKPEWAWGLAAYCYCLGEKAPLAVGTLPAALAYLAAGDAEQLEGDDQKVYMTLRDARNRCGAQAEARWEQYIEIRSTVREVYEEEGVAE